MNRRSRSLVVAVGLVLAPALAGCATLTGGCATVTMPPPRQGARVAYNASGWAYLPESPLTMFPWGALDDDLEDSSVVPEGGRVRIAIGLEPSPRFGWDGRPHEAFQVSYWADHPDATRDLPFRDVWLAPGEGGIVQTVERPGSPGEGDGHGIHPSDGQRPYLLFAPLFWNETLRSHDTGRLDVPDTWGSPSQADLGDADWWRWEVEEIRSRDGVCLAEIRIDGHDEPTDRDLGVDLRLQDGVPWPVLYRVPYEDEEVRSPYQMGLASWQEGTGSFLASYAGRDLPDDGLDRAPPRDGFPDGSIEAFPTSYREAEDAIRDHGATAQWLSRHPEARVAYVLHQMGAPASEIQDRWTITWADPDDAAWTGEATKRNGTLPGVSDPEMEVDGRPGGDVSYPPIPGDRWVTLDALADLHRRYYGRAPETLLCNMETWGCDVGRHETTVIGYAGESWSGGRFGAEIWIDRGWFWSEFSTDESVVGPPVG